MLPVQVQCYVRSQTALSAQLTRGHCLFISSLCTALCSSQVRCNAWIYVRQQTRRRRRGGEADGRLDCTGVCSAGGAAMPRLRPAEKSRLASRVQKAHSVHSNPARTVQLALKRSALHWKHCVIGCCCETTWSVAASCRCNPCSALPLIIIVIIMITIIVVIIVVIMVAIIVTITSELFVHPRIKPELKQG